ncbi:endoribonuclease L-PSP [Pelagibacterium halotolerans]|uniref:Endoribonuclease L-PSP n=2 Tax=Pelagibacterium TaxID=1082930 RepID=G4REM2_PELHB|nr:endoribonuclease L-PSP [Pelagibacterium halotolerans B2]SDZ98572.1 endoribonuclease L-PSP [Pelagibacterium halotolerans]
MSAISTDDAPAAIGPYSQARKVGSLLFVSGQLPIDPATGSFSSEDAGGQMTRCMANIAAIARAAGATLDDVVKTTILVTDLGAFDAINAAYSAALEPPYPARACYEVSALPKGAKVEVEAVIALKG